MFDYPISADIRQAFAEFRSRNPGHCVSVESTDRINVNRLAGGFFSRVLTKKFNSKDECISWLNNYTVANPVGLIIEYSNLHEGDIENLLRKHPYIKITCGEECYKPSCMVIDSDGSYRSGTDCWAFWDKETHHRRNFRISFLAKHLAGKTFTTEEIEE